MLYPTLDEHVNVLRNVSLRLCDQLLPASTFPRPKKLALLTNFSRTMRLLSLSGDGSLELKSFNKRDPPPPPYAILSHTWTYSEEEFTYKDLAEGTGKQKKGYSKIQFCSDRAAADGLKYFWVDTCCINRSVSEELTGAINSMFRWYQGAAKCYVYLTDVAVPEMNADTHAEALPVSWRQLFRRSR